MHQQPNQNAHTSTSAVDAGTCVCVLGYEMDAQV